jgi:hypothetical protein
MVSHRLQCLAQLLHSFAGGGEPLAPEQVLLVAHAIEAMLPQIGAMESRPIPTRYRVVQGGRGDAA